MIYDHAIHTTTNITLFQFETELVHVYIKQYRWYNSTLSYTIKELVTPTYTKCLDLKEFRVGAVTTWSDNEFQSYTIKHSK